jgi:hypothetical protein
MLSSRLESDATLMRTIVVDPLDDSVIEWFVWLLLHLLLLSF